MNDIAIRIEHLSKQYRIGGRQEAYRTMRDAIMDAVTAPFRKTWKLLRGEGYGAAGLEESIWALKDVSQEIKKGEVVGVIGANGAGKTTLLKILSRITEPTEGRAEIRGRVGSLLEVGTGFHAELTGRENIYLNGAILGMKKAEINKKFDDMVAFSELAKFIETPVKYYSSGMYVRLAFAVAAHLEPEILLVDEVLAVGDAAFRKKCMGKMGDVAGEGRTVMFVSHNMGAVQSLCHRVIWLDNGGIREVGEPGRVVADYLRTASTSSTDQAWDDIAAAPGNAEVRLRSASVRPTDGTAPEDITIRTPIALSFEFWNLKPGAVINLSLFLYNEQGVMVFNSAPLTEKVWSGRPHPVGLFRSECHVPGDLLNDGIYRVVVLVVRDHKDLVFRFEDIVTFEARDAPERRGDWYGKWHGAVRPELKWTTELVEDSAPTIPG